MAKINLTWQKCGDDKHFCNLLTLDLESIPRGNGVYLIWHGGTESKYVRVGQGDIRDRLSKHRNDNDILKYKDKHLYVIWAYVASNQLDGIEAYLGRMCSPLLGDRFPDADEIEVNLPE